MPSPRLANSNLQILGQFVTSLNHMSSEVLSLAVRPEAFPSLAVNSLSPEQLVDSDVVAREGNVSLGESP